MTLGLCDWGIGGLDLFRRLRSSGCTRNIHYFSDAGAAPYGTIPEAALAERVATVADFLAQQGCSDVVVACNAASTVLQRPELATIRSRVNLVGVIEPTVAQICRAGWREVAVIGGRRTIESGAYALPLRAAGCRVVQRVAQPLSALIEKGFTEGPEIDRCLRGILGPLRNCETLVLACTHYIAALPVIQRMLPHLRTVVDPAAATLAWIHRFLPVDGGECIDQFTTTGSPGAMHDGARRVFCLHLPQPQRITL